MPGPIRHEGKQAAALPARTAANASAPSLEAKATMDGDVFQSSPEQLKAARAVLGEAARMAEGSLPLSNAKKKVFVAEAKDLLAQAEQAESRLFFARDGASQAEDGLAKLRHKVASAERRMGNGAPLGEPLNPFRPLFQATKASESLMARGGFWALIGLAPLVVAPIIDGVDLLTRPVQLVVWPFHAAGNLAHKALLQPFGIG